MFNFAIASLLIWNFKTAHAQTQPQLTLGATVNFQSVPREKYLLPLLNEAFESHCAHSIPEKRTTEVKRICEILQIFFDKNEIERALAAQNPVELPEMWSLLDLKLGQWNLASIFSDPVQASELILEYFEKSALLGRTANEFSRLITKLNPGRPQVLDEVLLPLLYADLKSKSEPLVILEFAKHISCLTRACDQIRSKMQYEIYKLINAQRPRFQAIAKEIAKRTQYLGTDSKSVILNSAQIFAKLDQFLSVVENEEHLEQPCSEYLSARKSTQKLIIQLFSRKTNLSDDECIELVRSVGNYSEMKKLFQVTQFTGPIEEPSERSADVTQMIERSKSAISDVLLKLELNLTKDSFQ